jgi:hypothetical protein
MWRMRILKGRAGILQGECRRGLLVKGILHSWRHPHSYFEKVEYQRGRNERRGALEE